MIIESITSRMKECLGEDYEDYSFTFKLKDDYAFLYVKYKHKNVGYVKCKTHGWNVLFLDATIWVPANKHTFFQILVNHQTCKIENTVIAKKCFETMVELL
jgi:hypothetical protein